MTEAGWKPTSWRRFPTEQQPSYDDPAEVEHVLEQIRSLPPLVTSWEVESLRTQLGEAAAGTRFLLQGGDCAESFDDCRSEVITAQLKILMQMSLVLTHGLGRRVIRVGRFAGQYAKPRSSDTETRNGVTLPSYRGEMINGLEFTAEARRHHPERMLRACKRAALTLNFIRALTEGGFADLRHPEYWDVDFVRYSSRSEEYREIVASVEESVRFMEAIVGDDLPDLGRVDFFTSHEGLHLPYESAQTRRVPYREGWFNLASHMPWVGVRTLDAAGGHVEYFRGIENPIGIKAGPQLEPEELLELLRILDPDDSPGRLTVIHRMGHQKVAERLPPLIEAVRSAGRTVLWCCDPMHGNTRKLESGLKTRRFDEILSELEQAFDLHEAVGSHLGGVHLELTGGEVTECVGGARELREEDLLRAYRSQVDPRLNSEQALEVAMLIARKVRRRYGAPA